jgi:hypothetical protein
MGGMGPGRQPFGHGNDVSQFERDKHYGTHSNYDKRRQRKMSEDYIPEAPNRGTLANFLFVGGIISLGVFLQTSLFEGTTRKKKAEK